MTKVNVSYYDQNGYSKELSLEMDGDAEEVTEKALDLLPDDASIDRYEVSDEAISQ